MKMPTNNEDLSFSIRDKFGKEIPYETLDKEANDFWNKNREVERISAGAYPNFNFWAPKQSWSEALHSTFKGEIEGTFSWEQVKLKVTDHLATRAGNQILKGGLVPEKKYHSLRDYYEIIGAFRNLFDFWKNEKKYELVSVSFEQ